MCTILSAGDKEKQAMNMTKYNGEKESYNISKLILYKFVTISLSWPQMADMDNIKNPQRHSM